LDVARGIVLSQKFIVKICIYIYTLFSCFYIFTVLVNEFRSDVFFAIDIFIIYVLFVYKADGKTINVWSITTQTEGTGRCFRRKCLLTSQEISCFFIECKFHCFVTRSRHWGLSWATRLITQQPSLYWRSTLISLTLPHRSTMWCLFPKLSNPATVGATFPTEFSSMLQS